MHPEETATCFGQGVGPLAVGMLNDAMQGAYGAQAVRYSLLSASAATLAGAQSFQRSSRRLNRSTTMPPASVPAMPARPFKVPA